MTILTTRRRLGLALVLLSGLGACGGGGGGNNNDDGGSPASYTVGGTISGLGNDRELRLRNNNTDEITVRGSREFTFPAHLNTGQRYSVTLISAPEAYVCTLDNAQGTISGHVKSVTVNCSEPNSGNPETPSSYPLGGTVNGLPVNTELRLRNNGASEIIIKNNGAFSFATEFSANSSYNVTITQKPSSHSCEISQGSGKLSGPVSSIAVNCRALPSYAVGGTLTGLPETSHISLRNNDTDNITLSVNGSFQFPTPLPSGSNYNVTISSSPAGYSCLVSRGSGSLSGTISNISIHCEQKAVTTFAGSSQGFADGMGTTARFNTPYGILSDGAGGFYVADGINHRIRHVNASGVVSTVAGTGEAGTQDGPAQSAQFNLPTQLLRDEQGNLYVADTFNHRIRKISPDGTVSTVAGSSLGYLDGPGMVAQFQTPTGLAQDSQGNLYVADMDNHRIRRIAPNGMVSTLAGSTEGWADGQGSAARFSKPSGLLLDSQGTLYVTDTGNQRIRTLNLSGQVSTPSWSLGTDNTRPFTEPYGLTRSADGTLYVADAGKNRIRQVTATGLVSTLAGSSYGQADGTLAVAQFRQPYGLTLDQDGKLYVADTFNHRIRVVILP